MVNRLTKITERIKKNKKVFIAGAISLAGLTLSQTAGAQNRESDGKPHEKIENLDNWNHESKIETGCRMKVYFGPEELAAAVHGIPDEKIKAFKKSYFDLMDDELKATTADLIRSLQKAGMSEQEVIMALNRVEQANPDKNIDKDMEKTPPELTFTAINNERASLEFVCFNRDEMIIRGSSAVNLNTLLPNVYRNNLGGVVCGGSEGPDISTAVNKEKLVLKDLVLKNEVYNYLSNKDNLNVSEQNFVKNFPEQLSVHGLSIDKKGNLVQKDYVERLQKMKGKQNN